MGKVIKFKLDPRDIDRAIKELREYRRELNAKLEKFIALLLQDGITVARTQLMSTVGDSVQGTIGFGVDNDGEIISATVSLDGKDALFIEFGAGIAYNTGHQHPLADEFGYGIGTYPSKTPPNKAMNPGYWIYREPPGSENVVVSIGTQASMPVFTAAENMRNNLIKRALEIFRS